MYQQITLIGNLGADPEMRFTQDGTPVTSFRIATNRRWRTQDGTTQEENGLVSCFGMATAGRDVQPVSDEGATGAGCR